jgi:hypothetical protein
MGGVLHFQAEWCSEWGVAVVLVVAKAAILYANGKASLGDLTSHQLMIMSFARRLPTSNPNSSGTSILRP